MHKEENYEKLKCTTTLHNFSISVMNSRKASWCLDSILQVWNGSCNTTMLQPWAATVKQPQSAISIKLMDMICRLQLECGASLKAICAAIQHSSLSSKVWLIVASIHMIPLLPSPLPESFQFEKRNLMTCCGHDCLPFSGKTSMAFSSMSPMRNTDTCDTSYLHCIILGLR